MEDTLYKKYVDLGAEIKEKTAERDLIKEAMLDELAVIKKKELPFGKFTESTRKTWQYSDEVKELQFEEQEKGIAKVKESKYVTFTPVKS